ncbi:AAA family ATPase [Balneolaceae bacterium YR4-1]|uniref:AAA family ATPase n=1 Tax=Halalkalibaculum roseum TaxID=2709311 RepID=A0A6M1SSJ7_9BACT|nr:AAA family ATPase [Halalkalibaculum roseum]NGP75146.1 AAA family ATPase [Halalkalibaculum roseum]
MKHLSMRVAWHDSKWNGTVCNKPNINSYCLQLPRIYENKKDDEPANAEWKDLEPEQLPPCKAEGGAFMSPNIHRRGFTHPYQSFRDTHKHLEYTIYEVPPYTTFAVPYWWMLEKNQDQISEEYPNLIQNYQKAPFRSPWIFDHQRQHDIVNNFFGELDSNESLVLFYTKSGQPINEDIRRLLVGIGEITKVGNTLSYKKSGEGNDYPIWDRQITHSIRDHVDKESHKGFLIPYHEYLELPDDYELKVDGEIKTKDELLEEISVSLLELGQDLSRIDEFSYGSEHIENRSMLAILSMLREIVTSIQNHGIVKGPWRKRLQWLGEQIGKTKDRIGPFPSFGQALVAFGFRHGHLFAKDIYDLNLCDPKGNPWDVFDRALHGRVKEITSEKYYRELQEKQAIWDGLSYELQELLELLSRFNLTARQIKKWYNPDLRKKFTNLSTETILANPYVLVEDDDPEVDEHGVSIETIDSGVFEDKAIQGDSVPADKYRVDSNEDKRRVRAAIVELLKRAAEEDGDTLLSFTEICERINALKLPYEIEIDTIFLQAHVEYLKEKLTHITTNSIQALQLKHYDDVESYLKKVFVARALKELESINEDWEELIVKTIEETGATFDPENQRHLDALEDQAESLEKISTHKLSVLHGPAGTGKTSVLGAFVKSKKLREDGILLLAPTGKARVKLGDMAGTEAYTIAQFLTRLKRFDWKRMKPRFIGKKKYRSERTIIVDECSMLTEDDFYALFQAIDMAHVERIILVGDPYQLPPIGAGRPFADLCSWLDVEHEDQSELDKRRKKAAKALARLEVVVRTSGGADSDTLALANWFAGRKAGKNNDSIFERIGDNEKLNDLRIEFWESDNEIEDLFKDVLIDELDLNGEGDYQNFNRALGAEKNGFFPQDNPEVVENMQILTPQKNPIWGSYSLNRLIQENFRERPSNYWERTLGDQHIWEGDKVIQLKNEKRKPYKEDKQYQLSNGQIGYVFDQRKNYLNVYFSGHPKLSFGFSSHDFDEEGGLIELAYTITIHKSQGSDFNKVFLIIPKDSPLLSRELLYTGLTRAKDQLVLLVEGDDFSWISKYSNADSSLTARRNTLLFNSSIRKTQSAIPYVENLIHKTNDGTFVRSKSEVIIANLLYEEGIEYEYERPFQTDDGWRLPDFTFIDPAGDLIILEHLGLLHKQAYKEDWLKKKTFYEDHGFILGENLFVTVDDERGGINSQKIKDQIIPEIKERVLF